MRHITMTAILLTLFGLFSNAQSNVQPAAQPNAQPSAQASAEKAEPSGGKISGIIIDDKGLSLESVTVALLSAVDSSRIKETVTNKAGRFAFSEVPDGKYLVLATFVGYNRLFSQPVE